MKCRKFIDGDEPKLLQVFLSSVRNIASHDYSVEQIEAWAPSDMNQEEWFSNIKALKPFVVEINDEIAGYADIQPNGYIDNFYVCGAYSKQGVGTLLMNQIHKKSHTTWHREIDFKCE